MTWDRPAPAPERDPLSALSDWQAASADILARIDEADLPLVLDAPLKRLAPYDLSCGFAYPDEAPPLFIFNGMGVPGPALDNYPKGAHLLDPFTTACARRVPDGLYRMALPADVIAKTADKYREALRRITGKELD